ncbi:hypothetical protein F5Y01DRAFT_326319 [Xylaria sp. FL0043]|nr:hypothetical protein F5Y01DRAFT_326319 [Xylaria sp. FL0043]
MPSMLKDCVVAIAGDLDNPEWREEKVKQWVQYWGGTFSEAVDENVTHLLCTEENYKKRISPVRAALKNKVTKIVLRDWLEQSISKKRRWKTLEYQLDTLEKQEKAKKRKLEQQKIFSSNAKDYVDERYWHVYRDSTYFEYRIELTRTDKESGKTREKYQLILWESNAKPRNYLCAIIFTNSKRAKHRQRLHDSPVDLKVALEKFKSFFKKKTKIAWDDRIDKMGTTGSEHFQYQPPTGGKPVGLMKKRHPSPHGEEVQEVNSPAQDINTPTTPRKRPREEHVIDLTTTDTGHTERSAKKPRRERTSQAYDSYEQDTHNAPGTSSNNNHESQEQDDAAAAEKEGAPAEPLSTTPVQNAVEYPEVEDDYYTITNDTPGASAPNTEGETHDDITPNPLLEAPNIGPSISEIAEKIIHQSKRGVRLTDAQLIDFVAQRREILRERREKKKREEKERQKEKEKEKAG